jgi:hypothetical protein
MPNRPHEPRRGWLKNGNRTDDFSKAPRCGAQNRRIAAPASRYGKRALPASRGTQYGPKTAEGLARIRRPLRDTVGTRRQRD